jgi:diacylglycerol kinase family enzyme
VYRNPYLIYNPKAGRVSRSSGRLLQRSIQTLRDAGCRVTPLPTTGPETAGELARQCVDDGADLILTLGGDGTINEVANGLIHTSVPLGILPGGTANVLAMEMRMGSDPIRVAGKVNSLVPVRVATGLLQGSHHPRGRHFVLMAGVGLDAYIVYHLNLEWKARMGKLAYWLAGFSQVGKRIEEFDVIVDGRPYRAGFALCSRVRNYGGDLEIARGANLLDDDFETVLFQGESVSRYLGYFAALVTGRLSRTPGVTVLRARHIEFGRPENPDVYIQIDGEGVGRPPAAVSIVPESLTLLVPDRFLRLAQSWRGAGQPVAVGRTA